MLFSTFFDPLFLGMLIQGWWYVHVLSLLASTCIGMCTCTYYVQPLGTCTKPNLVHAHTKVCSRDMCMYGMIQIFIKFIGCLEAASERTNVPLSSAHTWNLFHHHPLFPFIMPVYTRPSALA